MALRANVVDTCSLLPLGYCFDPRLNGFIPVSTRNFTLLSRVNLHPFLMWKCRTLRCSGQLWEFKGGIPRVSPEIPTPLPPSGEMRCPSHPCFIYFFSSPSSCGWEAHETLNSHGEIIGMKLEKLNFDEAISGCFLIALSAVKRR